MIFFYNIFLAVYKTGINIAARWNSKAKKWVDGRQNWQQQLVSSWKTQPGDFVVWVHCASLGEFEQGRPVIEKLRSQNPKAKILLTFFSPSGYEIRKNYNGADYVMYLPFDSKVHSKTFLDIVQPKLAVFVKYEFWHYYLQELHNRNIEAILISGIFRPSQPFFKWWGSFHRNMLQNFSHLFVQNQASKELLDKIGLSGKTTVAGDTRFDRVITAVNDWKPVEYIEQFCNNQFVIVAGSTWHDDEKILAEYFNDQQNNQKLIIAPHEIKEENIKHVQELFPNAVLFSEAAANESSLQNFSTLIINNIGYLSRLYKYGNICYVGGGFNASGHHNILEAAVYNKPVITGPNYQKFKESVDLKDAGGSFCAEDAAQLKRVILSMNVEEAGKIAGDYVQQNGGATATILKWLQEKRLLTSA